MLIICVLLLIDNVLVTCNSPSSDGNNDKMVFNTEIVGAISNSSSNLKSFNCIELYDRGVEAYIDQRYADCVIYFESAIRRYAAYKTALIYCRYQCHINADSITNNFLLAVDVDDLHFYERQIRNTLCLLKCRQHHRHDLNQFNSNHHRLVIDKFQRLFELLKPYEYLHICYHQTMQHQKAASAVFTYLVLHPDNTVMSSNLKYYTQLDGVNISRIINYEAKDFVYLYMHGINAYERHLWSEAVTYMEESLTEYLKADEECRLSCEGPFDQGWLPDFIPSIANHFTFTLKCKRVCPSKLNTLNGEHHQDLFASHYNYLQYAYYQLNKLKEACEAVSSYLLFDTQNHIMLDNQNYYRNLPNVRDEFFTPRAEAVNYLNRVTYESKLWDFIAKEFGLFIKKKKASMNLENRRQTISQEQASYGN